MQSYALITALIVALGMVKPADAVPVTYDMTLTATGIGSVLPVFGISSLPAGPFTGSFSFDSPLAPNESFLTIPLTAFSLSIGTDTWSSVLGDDSDALFSTDAAGAIDTGHFLLRFSHPNFGDFVEVTLQDGISNLGWYAMDVSGGFCAFGADGPNGGSCIGGGRASISLVERQSQQVPEPASLALLALGLAGLGFSRRKKA